jgi:hypothetical protein
MSSKDNDVIENAERIADRYLDRTRSDTAHEGFDLAATDPEAAADRVTEHWINSPKSLILACAYLLAALNAFANRPKKFDAFLMRLVARRVLSENDILARLKVNGKLAMLRKIGQHADTLLQASLLCFLPGHYSIIYQICLLIEEVGSDRAEFELSTRPDATRDDVVKVRAALKADEREPIPSLPPFDDTAAQLIVLRLRAQELRPFASDYVDVDTLDRCLRRPKPADDAGLVGIVPILMLSTFEHALMPLLGFGGIQKLFLESSANNSEITDLNVIVVAWRGNFRSQPLTTFPTDLGHYDVLALADMFFPDSTIRCQLFARARTDGWLTLIGDENWNEKPSVR